MDVLGELAFISLVTCALSSGWLYSALFEGFRAWWLRYYEGKKVVHLAVCQLCCSFWFALPITYLTCQGIVWYGIIMVSLAAAMVSWLLGAIVVNNLWQKAYYEKQYHLLVRDDPRGGK
jgi:hypothetical protein